MIPEVRSLVPVPELQEYEPGIGLRRTRQQAEAADGGIAFDGVELGQYFLHLCHHVLRALQRGGIRQLQRRHHVALVLFGHEAGGHGPEQQHERDDQHGKQYSGAYQLAGKEAGEGHELAGRDFEIAIEGTEEPVRRALALARRLQQQRRQRRAQRQRVDRRDRHGDGDGDRELLVQRARDAAHRGDRDEYRDQGKRCGDDRCRDFAHGFDGRFLRGHAFLHLLRHGLDDDDGVVHDDADGEHEPEQRQAC